MVAKGFYEANNTPSIAALPLSIPAPHLPSFLSLGDEYIRFLVGD